MTYFAKVALLAALYVLTGKLGLLLAVPPGYATIIWPPSGIALGMLIVHGWRLWPGVLLGSLLLNGDVAGAYSPELGFSTANATTALGIAVGSTLQALAGCALIDRFVGLPLRLGHVREVLRLFVLAAPVACLVAASFGIATLYFSGALAPADVTRNWFAWWLGDVFGIVVFLPLMLVMRVGGHRLTWRDRAIGGLPMASMLVLVMPLGLSFYAWKVASESAHRKSHARFEALAVENERALLHRLISYENAALGGAGFFQGSNSVSREEWRSYVEALRVQENFPGINGIGWVKRVPQEQLAEHVRQARADGSPHFRIHPGTRRDEAYVITYIEPEQSNRAAVGLNIDFEANRRAAADLSRDTGKAAITQRIVLVQDERKTPGFLLLHPVYAKGMPVDTPAHRREALQGWIYAPFIAENFLDGLTRSQGEQLNITIYDGPRQAPQKLIFGSGVQTSRQPAFTVRKQVDVLQRSWTLVWESTPAFEQAERTNGPLFLLVGGLLFTGLFGLFLMMAFVQQRQTMEWLAGERQFALPLAIFVLLAAGSYALYDTLEDKELGYVRKQMHDEARKIELLLTSQANDKIAALQRMAQRWVIGGGTPYELWRNDARNYTQQLSGLKALEWIDSTYRVRWVEPLRGNESAVGLNVRFDAQRTQALTGAAALDSPTLTEPIDLVQGYPAFIAYLPLTVRGRFDGFVAGVFSIEDFFAGAVRGEIGTTYALSAIYHGKSYFSNGIAAASLDPSWTTEKRLQVYDKQWTLRLVPTLEFIESQKTSLPKAVLVAGLLIAALSALSVRYILVSRLRAAHLEDSSKTLREQQQALRTSSEQMRLLVENTPAAVAMFDHELQYMMTSRRWVQDYGLEGRQIVGKSHYEVFPELLGMPRWLDVHRRALAGEVFEIQEDSWVREGGQREWIEWAIHPWRDDSGKVGGIVMFTEVITQRKQAEEALRTSEATFRTAMDHAPIGKALVSPSGRFLKVNPALSELLGYSEQELVANDFQSITHPQDLAQDLAQLERLLAGEINSYELEKRYYHKRGHLIWALLSVSLVRHENGAVNYLIAQIQDITERKEMERMKNEFISVVSHELRTPLTSIRGSLGLVLGVRAHELSEKVKSLIEIAYNNCERLVLLINDILDIDKIASGHMRFDFRNESLAGVTQQAVQANEAYARKLDVRIDLRPIDERIQIAVDAARYVQVLSNLLSNAAKFSPAGGSIEVWTEPAGEHVRVSVQDHGSGIPEEFQSRIFGKFSQADASASRQKGGTGLGLHITKQLVERMNGRVGFTTEAGRGTTFWVEFPIVPPAGAARESDDPVLYFKEPEPHRSLVLHIEDDADLSKMLAAALADDVEVVTATTLRQAEELLRRRSFAIIILDIGMPDGSGLDLLRRLNTLTDAAPPVVILSVDLPPVEVRDQVAAVMVKTRTPEEKIVQTVLSLLHRACDADVAGAGTPQARA